MTAGQQWNYLCGKADTVIILSVIPAQEPSLFSAALTSALSPLL